MTSFRKCKHFPESQAPLRLHASDDEDDDIPGTPLTTSSSGATVNGNVALAIKNYTKKQKLRGKQQTLVDRFINDVQTVGDAKLFITLLTVQNDLQRIIAAAPPYAVSPALKVFCHPPDNFICLTVTFIGNVQSYATAVLLSPKLGMYKGNMPVLLCGRIALMRKVYLKEDNTTFWDELNKVLAIMHTAAKGNEDARDLMFEGLIKKDKSLHGNIDIVYQASDDIQQEVDDVIAASSVDAAITVDLGAGQDNDGSDGPAGGVGEGTE
ncbi:hypothetical protein B0H10DRAFT_2223480 [Mycena sp. CBHHK59/15]|nr:hypothetical protein B0H10DRAFT_2223480 [Mycena sp. CBHHK59/15]